MIWDKALHSAHNVQPNETINLTILEAHFEIETKPKGLFQQKQQRNKQTPTTTLTNKNDSNSGFEKEDG